MFVLCLYDLIRGVSMVREITWSTQLLTCHCLHESRFLSLCAAIDRDNSGSQLDSRMGMQPLARRGVGVGERIGFRLGERRAEGCLAAELLIVGEQALADQRG